MLLRGNLNSSELPNPMILPDKIYDWIWELWDKSIQNKDEQTEWGRCMEVKTDDLLVSLHLAKGTKTMVIPDCKPEEHGKYVGFSHTHLPCDIGYVYPLVGFSLGDFISTLEDGDNLAIVTNGPEIYALVRTKDKTQPRQAIGEREHKEYVEICEPFDTMIQAITKIATRDPSGIKRADVRKPLDDALMKANIEMCRKLGFAFYRGRLEKPLLLKRIYRP